MLRFRFARTKFCAINIHFQYDCTERLHEPETRIHTHTHTPTHGNDTCIYSVHQFVCCCVCLSKAFTVLFLIHLLHTHTHTLYRRSLHLLLDFWHCAHIVYLNFSTLCDVCKSVWMELILLGLITSWQICTPHSHTLTHTQRVCIYFLLCNWCCLRFLNALIIDWSIVSVIFESIDQTEMVFFFCWQPIFWCLFFLFCF